MTAFEKAWYDHFDYIRRTPKDSIRHPGYTGPSGQDRRSHFRPDMMWLDRNPMDEGGWQRGIRREESGGRKTDNPSGWAVSRSDGYTNEEERRYKLDLALARLPLELNRPLKPGEILGLVEHEDDLQYLVDTGVMPSVLGGNSLDQVVSDLEEGVKDFKDVIGEAIEDGWIPPSRAGESKDEYYMSHAALDRLTMLDRMRAVINARLMDVPKEQLLTLVDDKSMAPKVMEDWYQHTKPIGFGHGDWLRHTPITAGALVRDTKNLSRLDGPPNIFDDIMGRIGNQPELKAMFRRLLSSEAADLLNTMDERRELDRIDPRGMPFSDAPSWFGPVQGPMEDFGDVEIRGQDPFSEEFQIMNRSSDSFEDAWDVVKADDDEPDWDELPREKLSVGISPEGVEYNERVHRDWPGKEIIDAWRNNPKIMDMIGEDGENLSAINPPIHTCKNCGKRTATEGPMGRDVWDDDYCSRNCSEGNDPTCRDHGGECQWEIEDMPRFDSSYSDRDMKQYQMSVRCSKCGDYKWGWVS